MRCELIGWVDNRCRYDMLIGGGDRVYICGMSYLGGLTVRVDRVC